MVELSVTVDDLPATGPQPRGTTRRAIGDQIIRALRRHAVPGPCGFVNGHQVRDDPLHEPVLRAWRDAGLPFGNHTFSHVDLARVSGDDFIADVERNEAILAALAAANGHRYFRYPYLHEGETREKREAVRRWLAAAGYAIVRVTVNPEDWRWNEAYVRCAEAGDRAGIARLRERFVEAALAHLAWSEALSARLFERPVKHILLLHIGAFTGLVLDDLLGAYRAAGVRFVGLDIALGDPAYAVNPERGWENEERSFLRHVADARSVDVPPLPPGPPGQ
ncbi:MAG TPA: polysaccharide deacetylase family protein [Candidatus Methylomirabilis sp.]|nr:polysaccharide deacetylase family protein [Candidatus Methylomirabilis sp.]